MLAHPSHWRRAGANVHRLRLAPPGVRYFHLVDLENLVGGSGCGELVPPAWEAYEQAAQVLPGDHVVVGTGPRLASSAWWDLPPGVRRVVGRGRNGADEALLAAADLQLVSNRFRRLVIGSGDRAFADVARAARHLHIAVTLVLGVGRPAQALLEQADRVVQLPLEPAVHTAS